MNWLKRMYNHTDTSKIRLMEIEFYTICNGIANQLTKRNVANNI